MAPELPTTIDRILVAQIFKAIYSSLPRFQNLDLSTNINYFFI